MEIGGFFEFPEYDCYDLTKSVLYALKTCYSKHSHNCLFVRDGRQAIKSVLMSNYRFVKDKKCYLPAYLCSSILRPFRELKLNVKFYPHSHPLKPEINFDLKDSVVFILDYFGVESLSNSEISELARRNLVILDIPNSIFNASRFNIKERNIFLVASLRKVFPIPDGGAVYYKSRSFFTNTREATGYEKMLEAMFLKKFYLKIKSYKELKDYFFKLYQDYESVKDSGTIAIEKIPEVSLHILGNLSIEEIICRRAQNLKYLYENLSDFFLFTYDEVKSPFFAPLVFSSSGERERVRKLLIQHDVYPPVHWELPAEVPKSFEYEHHLSKRIISIPIDQRYTERELSVVVRLLKTVSKNE